MGVCVYMFGLGLTLVKVYGIVFKRVLSTPADREQGGGLGNRPPRNYREN